MFVKNENENVILETSPSIKSAINIINFVILLLVFWNLYEFAITPYARYKGLGEISDAGIWLLIFGLRIIYAYIKSKHFKYIVTNQRVVKIDGLITRKTNEIPLSSIETINFKEGLIDRLLKLGTVVLTGTGVSKFELKHLEDPIDVKNKIQI